MPVKSTMSASVMKIGVQMTVATIWESAVRNAKMKSVMVQRAVTAIIVQRTHILTITMTVFVTKITVESTALHI